MANIPATITGIRDFLDTQARTVPESVDPATYDAGNAEALHWRGRTYTRSTTTMAADNVGVLVDSNGVKFVSNDLPPWPTAVRAVQATPPDNPALGDSWLTTAAAMAAWSSNPRQLATWTLHGWEFANPRTGWVVLDLSTNINRQKQADGSWSMGFGADSIAFRSIRPTRLQSPGLVPVAAIRNTPVPNPVVGTYVLVGTNGQGAFANRSNQIAYHVGPGDDDYEFSNYGDGRVIVYNAEDDSLYVRRNGEWQTDGVDSPFLSRTVVNPRPADVVPPGSILESPSRVLHTEMISDLAAWADVQFSGTITMEAQLVHKFSNFGNANLRLKLTLGGVEIGSWASSRYSGNVNIGSELVAVNPNPRTFTQLFEPERFHILDMSQYPSNRNLILSVENIDANTFIREITTISIIMAVTTSK